MRIALAQINSTLGDFEGNKNKILDYIRRAAERHCDLVLFPEAALFGYHPVDLLERPSLVKLEEKFLAEIHRAIPKGMAVVVGAIVRNTSGRGKGFWNAAVFLERGKKARVLPKQLLPTYDVFDEGRHIEPGDVTKNIVRFKGQRILVTVCEDIWAWPLKHKPWYSTYGENPLKKIKASAVDLVLNMSASPFTHTKFANRLAVTKQTAMHFRSPIIYVNMVGAQDELIFDGGSFALDKRGKVIAQCVRFDEDLNVVDLDSGVGGVRELPSAPLALTHSALVLGVRDFLRKIGVKSVTLGLSGGIDSAVVACLAADAVGPSSVTAVFMPGPFSSEGSAKWSRQLAENLGVRFFELPIVGEYESVVKKLEGVLGEMPFGVTHENIQARLRAVDLMAISNFTGSLVLGTSNKSELAMGYSTQYGDLIGGLLPIGDLLKTEVYELARYYNNEAEVIPREILERPASAELRPGQKTEDSLPPFKILDPTIHRLVEGLSAPRGETEQRILDMLMRSEFKRWQAPPILKVSDHAFGQGRRFPIAHKGRT